MVIKHSFMQSQHQNLNTKAAFQTDCRGFHRKKKSDFSISDSHDENRSAAQRVGICFYLQKQISYSANCLRSIVVLSSRLTYHYRTLSQTHVSLSLKYGLCRWWISMDVLYPLRRVHHYKAKQRVYSAVWQDTGKEYLCNGKWN